MNSRLSHPCTLPRLAVGFALSLVLAAAPASAAGPMWQLDFTGVITNSLDSGNPGAGGVLFGAAVEGGQNGLVISGRILIDSLGYGDSNPSIYNGVYGPVNGLFPQPADFFTASFTIAGKNFNASEYMGASSQHSIEFAAVQDIPPVNFVQQDIYQISDGSQRLLCSVPGDPATCSGGALATTSLGLKLFGIYDFVGSDALLQPLNLNAAAIDTINGGPGGGQDNRYVMQYYSAVNVLDFDARGNFNLTSLTLSPVAAVPEPASLVLGSLGIATLLLRRKTLASHGRARGQALPLA